MRAVASIDPNSTGKSVLCAEFVRHSQQEAKSTILFFFCNFRRQDANTASHCLRVITNQLVRQHPDFVSLVYEEYVLQGQTPSKKNLRNLISTLFKGTDGVRLFIDGLDECPEAEQKDILSFIRAFVEGTSTIETTSKRTDCKAAIFSRAVEPINKALKKSSTITLSQESRSIEQSIKRFVHSEILGIREHLDSSYVDQEVLERIEQKIVASAGGKSDLEIQR